MASRNQKHPFIVKKGVKCILIIHHLGADHECYSLTERHFNEWTDRDIDSKCLASVHCV